MNPSEPSGPPLAAPGAPPPPPPPRRPVPPDEPPTQQWGPAPSSRPPAMEPPTTTGAPAPPDWPTFEVPAVTPSPPAWRTPEPAEREERPGMRPGRAALLGALVGAIVAALIASLVTFALTDGDSVASADRPSVPLTTSTGTLDIQAILSAVQPSVVAIETSQTTTRGVFEGAGSGIVLSEDGLVLTNAHVIGGSSEITVVLFDGTRHQATLVGSFPADDLALVQVPATGLVPATLGSSDALEVGDEVIAIGNALNLGGPPTVTRGIVSAKDRDLEAQGVRLEGLIQTDAAINPGNSGGALVNAAGEVVGVPTAILRDAQNLGFAIPIDLARPLIEQLKAGNGAITPNTAFLGITSTDVSGITDVVRDRFGIDLEEGAFVTEVLPESAAAEAGLQAGDVIVEVDGNDISGSRDVQDAVRAREPGDEVEVRVVREGEELTVRAALGRRG
jgi:serine protease Do